MDPTDPVWMETNAAPPVDPGQPPVEGGSSREGETDSPAAGFVDFAETEPVCETGAVKEPASPGQWMMLVLLPLGFTFLLTLLFLAMRGVMDLGGMVALGGPYEIARPAPDYWWIFPVSIIGMIFIILTSMGMFSMRRIAANSVTLPFSKQGIVSPGSGGVSLVALFFWPAIFLSLGWNFCEYGFSAGEGLVWGWIICGVVFVLMGGLPLYLVMRDLSRHEFLTAVRTSRSGLWLQLMGIAAGIPLGILFFRVVS